MTPITITIPLLLKSEANERTHWRAKAKRVASQRAVVGAALRVYGVRPELPCVVILTRHAPRSLDGDNLASSMKAVRDAVAEWLGVDDRKDELARFIPQQAKAKTGLEKLTIHIRKRDARDEAFDRAQAEVVKGAA